jgi:hypothetical protein
MRLPGYRDSINSIANNINERNRFMIDSASAATQIQSLKESQRQFNKANDSYIQLLRFHTISLKENGEAKFGYYIQNLGQPAKVTKSYIHAFPDIPNKDTFSINEKIRRAQRKLDAKKKLFLTKEIPQHEVFGKKFSTDTLELVKHGIVYIYFLGEMFYTNLVTNKRKSYKFVVEFDTTTKGYKYLDAENLP